jgi:hypothetical protein
MKKTLFLLTFVLSANILFAQGAYGNAGNLIQDEHNQKDSLGSTYKLLYDNQVKSNDAILKTIFYALGGLGSAMLFVFASNWWFNEKKVERMKQDINNQISSEIEKLSSDLKKDASKNIENLNARFSDFNEKTRLELREDNKILTDNYQNQLKAFSENINLQVSIIKTSIDEKIDYTQREVNDNKDKTKNSIDLLKQKINRENKRLKMNLLQTESSLWLIKEVPLNALRCSIEEGIISVEINYSWNLKYVFEDITEILEKIESVRASDIEAFEKFISIVPSDMYVGEKANLVEIFKKKSVQIS